MIARKHGELVRAALSTKLQQVCITPQAKVMARVILQGQLAMYLRDYHLDIKVGTLLLHVSVLVGTFCVIP